MKFLIAAGLLSMVTAQPIPLDLSGGSSSAQRFNFYPQVPPFLPFPPQFPFPQLTPQLPPIPIPFPFPFPFDANQGLALNDLITLITFILNQLGGFIGK